MKKILISSFVALSLVVLPHRASASVFSDFYDYVFGIKAQPSLVQTAPDVSPTPLASPLYNTTPKQDPVTGMLVYNNNGIRFEYPTKLNTDYASLNVQVNVTKEDNTLLDSNGCYPSRTETGKLNSPILTTINGVKFCSTITTGVGAGQLYTDYQYMTFSNGNAYTVDYNVHTSNGCGVYENSSDPNAPGNEKYKACLDAQRNFDTTVVKPIQQSISTFAFTTANISNGSCGLFVNNVTPQQQVIFPLIVRGVIDNSQATTLGCSWQMFEGQAGIAQLYYNFNNQGWKAIGPKETIRVADWTATTTPFGVVISFDNSVEKVPVGSPMKIVFTEENAAALPAGDAYELPVVFGTQSTVAPSISPTPSMSPVYNQSSITLGVKNVGMVESVGIPKMYQTNLSFLGGTATLPVTQWDLTLNCPAQIDVNTVPGAACNEVFEMGSNGKNFGNVVDKPFWFSNSANSNQTVQAVLNAYDSSHKIIGTYKTNISIPPTSSGPQSFSQVTVLSPNGGQAFSTGQTIKVEWKTVNGAFQFLPSSRTQIYLLNNRSVVATFDYLPNSGSANITIPSTVAPGNKYKISVTVYAENAPQGTAQEDESDTMFTITSGSLNVTPTPLASPISNPSTDQNNTPATYVPSTLPSSPLTVGCSASPTNASVGNTVYWTMVQSGGDHVDYTYSWTGSDGLSGSGTSNNMTYQTGGTKLATVTVISGSQSATASCSTYVTPGAGVAPVSSVNPQITVTSPSAGQQFNYGDNLSVKWVHSGFTPGMISHVNVNLVPANGGDSINVSSNFSYDADGVTFPLVPLQTKVISGQSVKFGFPAGAYKVSVVCDQGNQAGFNTCGGTSVGTFNILPSTTGSPSVTPTPSTGTVSDAGRHNFIANAFYSIGDLLDAITK